MKYKNFEALEESTTFVKFKAKKSSEKKMNKGNKVVRISKKEY